MPEQTEITEYQLVRLHEKKDAREFRMITGGVIHRSGEPRRDLVPFDFQKVSEQTYVVRLTNLAAGEFGFLLPTDTRARRRIYSFSVME